MFRWTVSSCRAIAGTLALLGFSLAAVADQAPQSGPELPETSLGQSQPSSSAKSIKPEKPSPAKTSTAPQATKVPQATNVPPAAAPDSGPQSVPPGPAPAIPGLQGLMTPNGIALPGGVGFIRPGADTVGIQINTPDGPIEFTVPRRRRGARNVQEPATPQATTDAPIFGQPGQPVPVPGPQASVTRPPAESDQPLPADLNARGAGRPSRGSREFAHISRLFHARNYPLVLRRLERALVRDPDDRDLLQLRSLTQLALGDFKAAFVDAMTVLAQDDVWDWSTLRSLYHSADEYTALYRALEDRVIANPNAIDLRILLGYHNLMLGHREAARRHFERVLALDPSNEVARRIVAGEQPPQPRDSAQLPPPPGGSSARLIPVPARKRATTGGSSSSGGASIDLGQPAAPPQAPPAKPADPKPGG
jgi:hypothetical protein